MPVSFSRRAGNLRGRLFCFFDAQLFEKERALGFENVSAFHFARAVRMKIASFSRRKPRIQALS